MKIADVIGRHPINWVLQYDICGWSVRCFSNDTTAVAVNGELVPVIMRIIRNARIQPLLPDEGEIDAQKQYYLTVERSDYDLG